MKFIDEIKITVIGGCGGNGNIGYITQSKKKILNGGRGGQGGNVYIQTDNNINNFNIFKYQKIFKAENGLKGQSNSRTGKNGKDLFIKVPIYTQIYCLTRKKLIANLLTNNQTILIAKGGKYGLGSNSCILKYFLIYIKKKYFLGKKGENFDILLKYILKNDITIIGYPNTGKSHIFNKITQNFSIIGNYPYTTKTPILGLLKNKNIIKNITVLDLPNVINLKKIIQKYFFKHLQYSKLILLVLDITQFYEQLINLPYLLNKIKFLYIKKKISIWLIFNKIDLINNFCYKKNIILNMIKKINYKEKYFFISSYKQNNIKILLNNINNLF